MSDSAEKRRIAMWSGPRNISTAMLRSWGSRPDTFVCDEPLYAYYLTRREVDHPGVQEVIEHHDCDWRRVVSGLTGPIPEGKSIYYQKHMAHHLLPELDGEWMDSLTHAFLIREPKEMLTSLVQHFAEPALADTGLPQQVALFRRLRDQSGITPPVVDSRDVLENPRETLGALCEAVHVPFDEAMLSWSAGPRPTDGIWARHWYARVWKSTGFMPYKPKHVPIPDTLLPLLEACDELYGELCRHRIRG